MAEKSRRLKPRQRKTRPLLRRGFPGEDDLIHPPPLLIDGMWIISPPLSSRLYQKSAIGRPLEDGSIELRPEEILFCNWNRHVELPDADWLSSQLSSNKELLHNAVAFDYARSGGELLVPSEWIGVDSGSYLRWSRDSHPSKSNALAKVDIRRSHETIDWHNLLERVSSGDVSLNEVLVVDDELDVTMYRIELIEPKGDLSLSEVDELKHVIQSGIIVEDGIFIPNGEKWEWDSIGINHASGRLLSKSEVDWINSESTNLLSQLFDRGLLARPGFKFGCKWRVYDGPVSQTHAPWLMQPVDEAPENWEGACLSVRLAEGVNKKWVCLFESRESLSFLQITRTIPGR